MKLLPYLVFFYSITLTSATATAQAGELRIKGEATVQAVPEMLSIRIPLNAKEATYEQCNQSLMKSYNDLVRALQKAGIDKKQVKSSGVQINQNYTWVDRERKPDGYNGSMSLTLKMPHTHDNLNNFTKTMASESFDFGYQLSFELSEKQKSALEEATIMAALSDARQKSELIAGELGVRIIHIKEVIYGSDSPNNNPFALRENATMSADIEEIDLQPNQMEFQKNVTIIWAIAP